MPFAFGKIEVTGLFHPVEVLNISTIARLGIHFGVACFSGER
jgi:hypothetical protein